MMNIEWFADLKEGDIIRHKSSGEAYIVVYKMAPWGVVISRTKTATNPTEWILVRKGIPALEEK